MNYYAKTGSKFIFSWNVNNNLINRDNVPYLGNVNNNVPHLRLGQGNLQLINLVDRNNFNIPIDVPNGTHFIFNNGIYILNNNVVPLDINGLVQIYPNSYYTQLDNIMEPHMFNNRCSIIFETGTEIQLPVGTICRTINNDEIVFNNVTIVSLV